MLEFNFSSSNSIPCQKKIALKMKKTVKKDGLNIREWVRDRILFLAMGIFVVGAAGYIGAGKVLDAQSMWMHPVREFALLISLVGVISLGYEIFLRELTFNEYKEALQEIVNPDAVRLGIQGIYKNRSELAQATSVSYTHLTLPTTPYV